MVNVISICKGFHLSITHLLKTISQHHGITLNAKQQLDSFLHILAQLIADLSYSVHKPKTISSFHVEKAVRLIFYDDIIQSLSYSESKSELHFSDILISTAKKVEEQFNSFTVENEQHISRQNKAGIIFAPSTAEKFLRNTGANMVTKSAPVFLASILQSVCSSFLETAIRVANNGPRVRLSIRNFEIAVKNHDSISKVFEKYKIQFIGGGIVPEITFPKTEQFVQKKSKCMRQIKKYQKSSNCLLFPKVPFRRNTRDVVNTVAQTLEIQPPKIAEKAFITLQYYLEQYLTTFLKDANMLSAHVGRVKIMPSDMELIKRIKHT